MSRFENEQYPTQLRAIMDKTNAHGFAMASEPNTGALLKALAATKPAGHFLELGTGTGISAAWLLAGMDANSHLLTVDNDPTVQAIAREVLGDDPRIHFLCQDGGAYLAGAQHERYDLIFADTWPGKFTDLNLALNLLKIGGLYMIDDLLPQANWPEDHAPRVPALLRQLEERPDLFVVKMAWASGVAIATKVRNL
jgi:predicted O-methyltransferase YrrM